MSESESADSVPEKRGRRPSFLLAVLVALIPSCAVFGGLYYFQVYKPAQAARALHQDLMARSVGLATAPAGGAGRLAARFADADNDLLADPPADPAKASDPETLVFCWIPEEDNEPLKAAFKDFVAHLAAATSKKVVYLPDLHDSEEQLKALRDGKLHVTGFSTGTVPPAVNLAGFVPVGILAPEAGVGATAAGAKGPAPGKHQMRIIVPAGSAIVKPADLADRDLYLTEPNSNSGFKAPIVLLKGDFGLNPGTDYRIRIARTYESSIAGIAKKEFEAAAVASDVLDRAVAAGQIKAGDFGVIYTSEDFPSAAIGYAHDLKPELAEKIRAAILGFNFKGTSVESRFASSNQSRFIPVSYKNDFSLVRRITDAMVARRVGALIGV